MNSLGKIVIGVLGGMGSNATIHLFQQYFSIFPAIKEWDRPRIIIDNRCTMPSRVRAFQYNENKDTLINEMTDSLLNLKKMGANRIILACNTSHLFLPSIYEKVPELEKNIINIIDACVKEIKRSGKKHVYLLATEATIDSGIYQNALQAEGISCGCPSQIEYGLIRECIESVKQNTYSDHIKRVFTGLADKSEPVILGCTELPILYHKYCSEMKNCNTVYDPLFIVLQKIKKEHDELNGH